MTPAEAEAVAKLEELGGKVTIDRENPGQPVIRVKLEGDGAKNTALQHLACLPPIHFLDLTEAQVTDAGMKHVGEQPQLRGLFLFGTQIGDAGLKHLGGPEPPSSANRRRHKDHRRRVGAPQRTTSPPVVVAELHFDYGHWTGTPQGAFSVECSEPQWHSDQGTGLQHIKKLTQLSMLWLTIRGVTSAGLEHIKGLTKLSDLRLQNTLFRTQG